MRSAATPHLPADGPLDALTVDVRLLTAGSDGVSGGHRYHQHLLAAAADAGLLMSINPPRLRLRFPPVDVVIVDSLYAWKAVVAVRRRHRPRTVAIVHQHPGGVPGSSKRRSLRTVVELATYRACDMLVAPGPVVARHLIDAHGFDPAHIVVIEPGSDLPSGRPVAALRAKRRLGLLNVANWLPNKGIVELLDAVAAVPEGAVTLHLAGRADLDPEYTDAVRRRLNQADLVDRVVVHGALPSVELASLYAAADAFAFPSRVETYGSAIGEALRAGLPVVGWRTPHLCNLVTDEVEGLLVTPGRIDDLTDAIQRLASDSGDRERLADGARVRGARLPTWGQATSRFFGEVSRLAAVSNWPEWAGRSEQDDPR